VYTSFHIPCSSPSMFLFYGIESSFRKCVFTTRLELYQYVGSKSLIDMYVGDQRAVVGCSLSLDAVRCTFIVRPGEVRPLPRSS
jgi:hypothetical protein